MRRLETTVDLLDALLKRYRWTSDRQLAEGLGIPPATVSNWRRGRTFPTEVHAVTLAKALELGELGPMYVLAIAAADRSPDEQTRKTWLAQLAQLVALLALATGMASATYAPKVQAADVVEPLC